MADVFINSKREDRKKAEQLTRALEAYGYSVWSDLAIPAGVDFGREIELNIRGAKCLLTLWSKNSVSSMLVRQEAELGRELGILVNVRLDEVELPFGFVYTIFHDLTSWVADLKSSQLHALLDDVARKVGRAPQLQLGKDAATWAIAQTVNSESAFEQFIKEFPSSQFEQEARRRLADLRSSHGKEYGKVFLSYRRDDSQAVARLIFERLGKKIGPSKVFFDVDGIPIGVDFREYMFGQLVKCSTLFAIVGRDWLGRTSEGQTRIMDETDFVRQEMELAFETGLRIIPVLAGSATMPKPSDLPEKLKRFPFIQAAHLDLGRDYDVHIQRLIATITGESITQLVQPSAW
jgi:hypothetical protein